MTSYETHPEDLSMIEAVMLWNEPNNKSHWDPEIDPGWLRFAQMAKLAARAIRVINPRLTIVLGGISPIDPEFIRNMQSQGVLDEIDMLAVHGFPLDWNHWQIEEWPQKLAEIEAVCDKPVIVSEVGVSSFGSEEVQAWGLDRTAQLLIGRTKRIHWYSLYDLPRAWKRPRATRRRKVRRTTGISTWACCAKTVRRNPRCNVSHAMHRRSGCVNGFISKITGWMTRSRGCSGWACALCAPDSRGRLRFVRPRCRVSTGRCTRCASSM